MKPGSGEVQALLKRVSRSFYLTLHILPGSIRAPLSLAYLLARATDTIADTALVEVARRREVLTRLRGKIRDASLGKEVRVADDGNAFQASGGTEAEGELLRRLQDVFDALMLLPSEDRIRISRLLDTITAGQENDLEKFGNASPDCIVAFQSDEDLDRYTYQVAGCVGEFWTEMCCVHVFPRAGLDRKRLMADAVRFGKGLQLVNILRDLPKDLRAGRCYLPEQRLSQHDLSPQDLIDASAILRLRPLYDSYLDTAEDHLAAGWRYTASLPFRHVRIRLACAWPILIGMRTLELLRHLNVLDASVQIKVSRAEIRRIMLRSALLYPAPPAWARLGKTANHEAETSLRE
ncbi:MAG: squalene/phytoene synthase family protein [Acidobacteria bacterium]|nr:squalene/phytoene synthase family protein [Acidobacteriota bacterium]